jgi:hypothetical protein
MLIMMRVGVTAVIAMFGSTVKPPFAETSPTWVGFSEALPVVPINPDPRSPTANEPVVAVASEAGLTDDKVAAAAWTGMLILINVTLLLLPQVMLTDPVTVVPGAADAQE